MLNKSINVKLPNNNIANTEDRLNNNSMNITVTGVNDEEENEDNIIRNIKVNTNVFEKK